MRGESGVSKPNLIPLYQSTCLHLSDDNFGKTDLHRHYTAYDNGESSHQIAREVGLERLMIDHF